ncbi:hypothetical protein Saa2_00828 [Streptomyces acidiscabies]|nr:hypothetical protein Saa2_00828 [Streptomyces acidiscabies]
MGPRRGRRRRDRTLPHRPGLGPGAHLPPRPREPRNLLRPRRRLPRRSGPLRRRVLRLQPPRSTRQQPPAPHPPGNGMGSPRTRGDRPHLPQRQPDRRLHRLRDHRQPDPGRPRRQVQRGVRGHRTQRPVRPYLLQPRPGGTRRHRRDRVLLLAGRHAPRGTGTATGRVRTRPRGRRHRHLDTRSVHRLRPSTRTRPRRPLQTLRGGGRRHGLGRGRGTPRPRTPLLGPAQRPPRPRAAPGLGRQPGRRLQRLHRTQRTVPTPRHTTGVGERPPLHVRDRRRRGARHRDPAR